MGGVVAEHCLTQEVLFSAFSYVRMDLVVNPAKSVTEFGANRQSYLEINNVFERQTEDRT